MGHMWSTIDDMNNDMKNMETFNQIKTLYIRGNFKFYLPPKLTRLYCYDNQLSSLPELPNHLIHLHCWNNKLSSLPELPNTLTHLSCFDNQLSSLPELPNTLTYLDCSFNQLSSLPKLPNALTQLYCYNNQLLSLPKLPNTLTHLECNDNQLLSLPELPNTLIHLKCFHNPFNIWSALIDPTKIKIEYAEIIFEKLCVLDYKIKEIEDELNENTIFGYNKNMFELKKEIDKILNFEFEIIL
jgi:Leucine-rich repeat (LRR) protein